MIVTKFIPQTMKALKLLTSFVAVIALVALASLSVSAAFVENATIEINGEEFTDVGCNQNFAAFAGETIPVRVSFTANAHVNDVRVSAEFLDGDEVETNEFDVFPNKVYTKTLNVRVPSDIAFPSEQLRLEVSIASNVPGFKRIVCFTGERESDVLEILSVNKPSEVKAGQSLALDIVLKNMGRHESEDTYVRARIVDLGTSATVFFGDLTPVLVSVISADRDNRVISPASTKSFAVGEEKTYSLTLVNAGNEVRVYSLVVDAPAELSVDTDESIVVVPAGSSKTVVLKVRASEEGTHNFAVNIRADDELVKTENFVAKVEGTSARLDASVVLTVVLAVIFVVLVIVLIVLLTRKPQKEEFGESYY